MNLNSCPNCGSEEIFIDLAAENHFFTVNRFFAVCATCAMRGPSAPRDEKAAEAWNALPRALRWTKAPPSSAGSWWHRDELLPCREHVVDIAWCGKKLCVLLDDGDEIPVGTYGMGTSEWAGPIGKPK